MDNFLHEKTDILTIKEAYIAAGADTLTGIVDLDNVCSAVHVFHFDAPANWDDFVWVPKIFESDDIAGPFVEAPAECIHFVDEAIRFGRDDAFDGQALRFSYLGSKRFIKTGLDGNSLAGQFVTYGLLNKSPYYAAQLIAQD